MEGCTYIAHLAHPIPGYHHISASDMFNIAEKGTKSILSIAHQMKIKRMAITLSYVSVCGDLWKEEIGDDFYSEKDFAPLEKTKDPYSRSKVVQEVHIREYLNANPNGVEIVTLHPGFVIGPTLISSRNSTVEGVAKFLRADFPGLPEL